MWNKAFLKEHLAFKEMTETVNLKHIKEDSSNKQYLPNKQYLFSKHGLRKSKLQIDQFKHNSIDNSQPKLNYGIFAESYQTIQLQLFKHSDYTKLNHTDLNFIQQS
ncbi:hypothetical protein F8M41_016315 [Gigaspora margarita]|uniref:Uncharacterized protein n=1 Tax=Gigaspora margarita TaxID=4874 RepID=A0A8H3ZVF2_GIGMA|nr:hypothetical protein F8M41_016315 [Gigaspora margarita]